MAVGNLEYQSLSATWLIRFRYLAALLAHVTVFWETFYCVLVWPRLTRPIVLAIAAGVHLGIGLFLGMWTFGLAMLIANTAFVSPWVVRRIIDRQPAKPAVSKQVSASSAPANVRVSSRCQRV